MTLAKDNQLFWKIHLPVSVLHAAITGFMAVFMVWVIEDYFWPVFILLPLSLGFTHSLALSWIFPARYDRREHGASALRTLLFAYLWMVIPGYEGLFCILMSSILAIPMVLLGSSLGFAWMQRSQPGKSSLMLTFVLATLSVPAVSALNQSVDILPRGSEYKVSTSMVVDASAAVVWENVVNFRRIKEEPKFPLILGIAYPIEAQIKTENGKLVRYCRFDTGSFVEPVTEMDAPRLLRFDVAAQPLPMTELMPGDREPPHLDNMVRSQRGEFLIETLAANKVKLTGTTWYNINAAPAFYWNWWVDWFISSIHKRVLDSIKINAQTDFMQMKPENSISDQNL